MLRTPFARGAVLLVAPMALALAACGNAREPAAVNNEPPAVVADDFGGACNAGPAQQFVGETLDDALGQRIQSATGAERVRVIRPGMAVTMDYRADRLNIEIDDAGRIVRISCG